MNGNYTPTDDSTINERWTAVVLTTRDLGNAIPVNYVTWPGISLADSCFSDNNYTLDKRTCISNLLQLGFRRLIVDLYLDEKSGRWSLCPVASPPQSSDPEPSTSASNPSSSATSGSGAKLKRQATSTTTLSSETSTSSISAPTDSPTTGVGNDGTFTANGITCAVGADAHFLVDFLSDMLVSTGYNVNARLTFVTLNLRPVQRETSDTRPDSDDPEQLSDMISAAYSASVYTPALLANDRKNINESWLDPDIGTEAALNYFNVRKDGDDVLSTEDGWPTEGYLQAYKTGLRIMFSFGDVSLPQDSPYDIKRDSNVIFSQGYIESKVSFNKASCPIRINETKVADSNTSWAVVTDSSTSKFSTRDVTTAINCGLSWTLNSTGDVKDPLNGTSYFPFLEAAVWSWDKDEPVETPRDGTVDTQQTFRCTSMGMNGRWRVDDCATKYRAACRVQEQPYTWSLSTKAASYEEASTICARESNLGVPRSALQNQFLLRQMKDAGLSQNSRIWVDWNSISFPNCWVSGGSNATCPYSIEQRSSRYVVIPTVAAVVVLVLFCLFLFVKFANRQFSKNRRRRKKDRKRYAGHDYEGVPS